MLRGCLDPERRTWDSRVACAYRRSIRICSIRGNSWWPRRSVRFIPPRLRGGVCCDVAEAIALWGVRGTLTTANSRMLEVARRVTVGGVCGASEAAGAASGAPPTQNAATGRTRDRADRNRAISDLRFQRKGEERAQRAAPLRGKGGGKVEGNFKFRILDFRGKAKSGRV